MNFSDLHNPAAAAKVISDFKKRFSAKVCLSPHKNCSGGIISAHTLSVSSMLRPISKNGKVYSLKFNLAAGSETHPATIELKGVKETSVFNGFCAKHDHELFVPIENEPLIFTKKQLFLYAYRAVAKEAYLKRKQAEGMVTPEEMKSIHGLTEDIQFSNAALMVQAGSLCAAEEIEKLKARLDGHLLKEDFGRIQSTVFSFRSTPPITASFVYAPDFDFDGNQLQELGDLETPAAALMVTLLPHQSGGFLILSHEDVANSAPRRMIESLKQEKDISSSIAWLIACQTENFAISPEWYDALDETGKTTFIEGFHSNTDPFNISFNTLQLRKMKVADWQLDSVFTI